MLREVTVEEAVESALEGKKTYVFKNTDDNATVTDLRTALARVLGDMTQCRYLLDEDTTPIADNPDYPGEEVQESEEAPVAVPKKGRNSVDTEKIKELLEQGMKPADIARELGIAQSTVSFYRKRLEKMDAPVVTAPGKERFTLEDDEDAGK